MASTSLPGFKFKYPSLQQHQQQFSIRTRGGRRKHPTPSIFTFSHHPQLRLVHNPKPRFSHLLLSRASSEGFGSIEANPQPSPSSETDAVKTSTSSSGDGYLSLFVRMLGLDNDPLDREQAILALWKYAQGGKDCIDKIMQFRGCINLTINLLKSDSSSACEAAAGLLRTVSSVNTYRDSVAESGAIEEITGLLSRPSLTAEVKEQSICTLWNLSVDEELRVKIADSDLLPALIKFLDDEEMKVKEAAGGVLANLSLTHSTHSIMVEAGVIPKLANLLRTDMEGSKIIKKEAKNVLLELAKDEYYRILIMEEGLVLVPMIGTAAYKSFRPVSHSWPSLPDGTEIESSSSGPSRYGASELLIGLNIHDKNIDLEEAKKNAIVGRTHQQFLARIGAIELEEGRKPQPESLINQKHTLLPWVDGVARLVLILGLEDASAISRAAQSIADASINEHMRISFKEAGAIKHLVGLLDHRCESVRLAATHALERLSISNYLCHAIEAEDVIHPLMNNLKCTDTSESLIEKTLNILSRILDPGKEMKSKFFNGPVNGVDKSSNTSSINSTAGFIGKQDDTPLPARGNILDSCFIIRLIQILKTSPPNLQRKAASILEYVAITEPCMDSMIAADIVSGLNAVFRPALLDGMEDDIDSQPPELGGVEAEEAGLAITAASRLLTKLLDFEPFLHAINSMHTTRLLRKVLKSNIPLRNKDWIAACLVKLESLSGTIVDPENPINMDVTLYQTIPRLIEQIGNSFSPEAREAAVVELNRIISLGVVDCTRTVAAKGGIFPLVKIIEQGNGRAVEASLAILYNLSMDSENHLAIIAAGALPALRRIVLSQGPQWMQALHILRTLPT
ncbi:uncharacterized protein LOC122085865 [Macadamia integrifolia]|uniref:uncharacterized protein LOC122085865 n=1 Tax=Macadamia integrifolia TaxID=60698 RepID=UPI001C4EDBA9|nr:uncharacterized protein LOC122085865 [Macadamia integrifolia]